MLQRQTSLVLLYDFENVCFIFIFCFFIPNGSFLFQSRLQKDFSKLRTHKLFLLPFNPSLSQGQIGLPLCTVRKKPWACRWKNRTKMFICVPLSCLSCFFGPYPQYGWDFPEEIPEKFRKDPGNALRAFPGIPVKSTAGTPQTL